MANEGQGQQQGQGQQGQGQGQQGSQDQGQGQGGNKTVPWYEGKASPEVLGFWQNKGYDLTKPDAVALESGKAAFELQKHFGVPGERLLKLPADANDAAGWDGIYSRLGVPAKADEYDLSTLKYADGTALEDSFVAALRAGLHSGRVPKERAGEVAKPLLKFLQDADADEAAETTARVAAEQAKLKLDWGGPAKYDLNKLTASQGALRLGITPEEFAKLETTPGGARMMEMFRKVGAGTTEDNFREGSRDTNPTTQNGAVARLAELQNDKDWVDRFLKGDTTAKREFDNLTQIIAGVAA